MNFPKILVLSCLTLALCSIESHSQNEFSAPVPDWLFEPIKPIRQIQVDIKSYTAPDTVDGQSAAYYQQMGGGVIWLPDMSVTGLLQFYNKSQIDDYIAYSANEKVDLRDRITVVGAMLGNRYIAAKDLPPVKLSFIGERGLPQEEMKDDIILKPGIAVKGAYIFFEFPSKEYAWEPGLYHLTFEIDLYPGEQKPTLVQTSFVVKKIEKDEDRLNVLWFQYDTTWRLYILGGITGREFRESLNLLETIIASHPNNAALLHERVRHLQRLGEYRKANDALAQIIALIESGKSSTNVKIREANGDRELLEALKFELKAKTYYANKLDEVKAISDKSSPAEKQELIKALLYPAGSGIPPLALDKVRELKMIEAVPAVLQVLMKPEGLLYNIFTRERAWEVRALLKPEALQVKYDPYGTEEERKVVVAQLKVLLNVPG